MQVFVFIILFIFSSSAAAQWKLDESIDPMTDKPLRFAHVVNDEGYSLIIRRTYKGDVWTAFRLPRGMVRVFDPRLGLHYRVDKNEPVRVRRNRDLEKYTGVQFIDEPQAISWRIFHGKGPADGGNLRELMDGQSLLMRYFPLHEGAQDTIFPLEGAKQVIAQLLDIPLEGDSAAYRRRQEWSEVRSAGIRHCMGGRGAESRECVRQGQICAKSYPENPEELRACLKIP